MAEPDNKSAPPPPPPPLPPNPENLLLQTPNTRKNVRTKYMQKFMSPTDAISSPCTEKMKTVARFGAKGDVIPELSIKEYGETKNLQF